jgi:hypothetical protein
MDHVSELGAASPKTNHHMGSPAYLPLVRAYRAPKQLEDPGLSLWRSVLCPGVQRSWRSVLSGCRGLGPEQIQSDVCVYCPGVSRRVGEGLCQSGCVTGCDM